jgi:UDPglucose 6-dehydrogenase
VVLADQLDTTCWLPLARPQVDVLFDANGDRGLVLDASLKGGTEPGKLLVRAGGTPPAARELAGAIAELDHHRGALARAHEIRRTGTFRLPESDAAGVPRSELAVTTASNGTYVPAELALDEAFWRVAGLYVAEGHLAADGDRRRLQWTFHLTEEPHLVEEVASFWASAGTKATVRATATAMTVQVSSRTLAAWWIADLGLGSNCYEKRIPDRIWTESVENQRAFLAGMWEGDGSWSRIAGGPSVALEYGTASRELADGLLRLLAALGFVARHKIGRTANSTVDNHWIMVSGADQVERLSYMFPAPERAEILDSIQRQSKRTAPTGYRSTESGTWLRVDSVEYEHYDGPVYSLEVDSTHTFAATGGLVVHNCFPKDVTALKQIAGNSGYHFQLLNAVIEVNELQKRRLIGKLVKHLGPLRGKTITMLGLAFKPGTDDMREAASLVIGSRLLAEGATVRGHDPIAADAAANLLTGVEICDDVLEAARDADALVLVTEWPQYAELNLAALAKVMRTPLLVDGRNLFTPSQAVSAGLAYEGIGRPGAVIAPNGRRSEDRERAGAAGPAAGE